MINQKDTEIMKPIKDYAFTNGIDVEIVLRLAGLLLRDEYLKEHQPKKKSNPLKNIFS